MYNYRKAVESDVRTWLEDNREDWKDVEQDDLFDYLFDRMFDDDSVTGNGPGSYTMDRWTARCNVMGDSESDDIISDMVDEGILDNERLGEYYSSQNWEAIDVMIRCHLLDEILPYIVNEIEEERKAI